MELIKQNTLDKYVNQVLDGEMNWINLYIYLKEMERKIKDAQKKINEVVKKEVTDNPNEYRDFTVTWRTTYNYKDNDEWNAKNNELKEIEKKLKIATDMMMKWDTYVDSDWVIIEPVTTTNTEVLTYKKIKW